VGVIRGVTLHLTLHVMLYMYACSQMCTCCFLQMPPPEHQPHQTGGDNFFAPSIHHRSQINAASAAIKVYQAQQKIEMLQREQVGSRAGPPVACEQTACMLKLSSHVNLSQRTCAHILGKTISVLLQDKRAESSSAQPQGSGQAGASTSQPEQQAGQQGGASTSAPAGLGSGSGPSPAQGPGNPAAGSREGGGVSAEDFSLQKQALEEAALPLMLEAMWAANVLDIQATVRKVSSTAVHGCRVQAGSSHCPGW
jgi:hypothetical protein